MLTVEGQVATRLWGFSNSQRVSRLTVRVVAQCPARRTPDAIARAIAFAIEQPPEVDINEIVVRSTVLVRSTWNNASSLVDGQDGPCHCRAPRSLSRFQCNGARDQTAAIDGRRPNSEYQLLTAG